MGTENIFNKVNIPRLSLLTIGDSHWPATEIWSVSEDRPSLRSISELRKSEGKFMANLMKN